jgi:N-acyl-D-aspartate/D-glutamate deacylase
MSTRATELPEQTAEQMKRESDALRRIATLLGSADEWDSPADYLEAIAGFVAYYGGLPHPGDDENIALYTEAVR